MLICETEMVLINLSGRGDKDTEIVAEALAKLSGG
jgi:tryptophan synthase beta subunit